MKIIPVVGRANSGKTTFIRHLIPALKSYGRVGVIKHLADHDFRLEGEKDTTVFFESGAEISAGIDAGKSVIALHTSDLEDMLNLFKQQGIDFAVIEGFKTHPFPKIVIGDLLIETCILRNPSVDDIVSDFSRFEDY